MPILTCKLWKGLELLSPDVGDLDGLLDLLLLLTGEPNLLAFHEQLLGVFRVQGAENAEEVLSGALSTLGVHIREVVQHARQLDAGVVQLCDADLIIARRIADPNLVGLQQLLVALEDGLQERVGHHVEGRQVVLPTGTNECERWVAPTVVPSCSCRRRLCRRSCRTSPGQAFFSLGTSFVSTRFTLSLRKFTL